MYYNTTLVQIYNCKRCDKKRKRLLGCVRPFRRKKIWVIDECYFCGGENKKCEYCNGKGHIIVQRCPRAVANNCRLLPYFIEYKNSNYLAWPDGKGMYYQPFKLVRAFQLMTYYFNKFEIKRIENDTKKAKR